MADTENVRTDAAKLDFPHVTARDWTVSEDGTSALLLIYPNSADRRSKRCLRIMTEDAELIQAIVNEANGGGEDFVEGNDGDQTYSTMVRSFAFRVSVRHEEVPGRTIKTAVLQRSGGIETAKTLFALTRAKEEPNAAVAVLGQFLWMDQASARDGDILHRAWLTLTSAEAKLVLARTSLSKEKCTISTISLSMERSSNKRDYVRQDEHERLVAAKVDAARIEWDAEKQAGGKKESGSKKAAGAAK